ncbi:MAG: indolepyruvate oxidoreductase subunit beta [Syntrophales bacterium]|nr:indolepyruvate oxidoreductase subunit beta [Syntrophales bacterium]
MERKDKVRRLLLAGVGGQGILKASDMICTALMYEGLDVKKSEVHGMAQRGGSVTSHVLYGSKVFSPVAGRGEVDILIAFEILESLRYINYLKPTSKVILNDFRINPPVVNLGIMKYPEHIEDIWKEQVTSLEVIKAREIARKAGNFRSENVVMVGILARHLPVKREIWERVINESFSEDLRDVNIRAFQLGYSALPS